MDYQAQKAIIEEQERFGGGLDENGSLILSKKAGSSGNHGNSGNFDNSRKSSNRPISSNARA